MKLKIIVALMLFEFAAQKCDIGCLACTALENCTLCDSSKKFYLKETSCTLSRKPNCLVLGQNGACILCNKGFYLDRHILNCLAVPIAKVIANCNKYHSHKFCIECTGNFYLANGQCTAVTTIVSNCNTYISNGVCDGCSSGFVLSNDFSSCVVAPTALNCLQYSFLSCIKCKKGFTRNNNYYLKSVASSAYLNQYLIYMARQISKWSISQTCQQATVMNCAVYSDFGVCTQCKSGYFIKNGNCVIFPTPPIPGCLVYAKFSTCVECQPGMYLNVNTCVANTPIGNCANYDGTASSTICTKCDLGYYLSENSCRERTASLQISNCQTVTVGTDTCDACDSNFVLTTDKLACLTAVANCAVYAYSTSQSTSLSCTRCNNRFYLTNIGTTCTAGTVTGCLTYASSSNTCNVCLNGYYLNQSSNTCTRHVDISNCKTYSQNTANSCTKCRSGFYNFAYSVVCTPASEITGCARYASDGVVCSECSAGYYKNSGSCTPIPSGNSNCNTFTTSGCVGCNTGYILNTLINPNTCVIPLDYIYSVRNSPCSIVRSPGTDKFLAWGSSLSSGLTLFGCQTCNNLMYGYTPQRDEAICVSADQVGLYSGFSSVANCARYGYTYAATRQIVCMECNSGFFINGYKAKGPQTTSTSCASTCTNTAAAPSSVIPDDFLGFVNICIDSPVDAANYVNVDRSCARLTRIKSTKLGAANGGNADYGCVVLNQLAAENSKNYFMRTLTTSNSATTLFYTLDIPSIRSFIAPKDFNNGYSNTVDSNSLVPTVFNYKGLLNDIFAVNILNSNILLATGSNLNNCDIIVNYPGSYAFKGYAYVTGTTVKSYAAIPTTNTAGFHSCFRCTFGYQLTYTGSGTTTNNSPFPSCSQMNNCAGPGIVYGGLSTFFNSVFSCHSCSTTSGAVTFPTIYFETSGGSASTIAAGIWTGWTVSGVYSATGSISDNNHGFRCAAAPSAITVPNGNAFTGTSSTFTCAAFGNIQLLSTFPPVDTATIPTVLKTCLACPANFFPTYVVDSNPVETTASSFALTEKVPAFIVKACTASNKCDTTIKTQFNSCAACIAREVVGGTTTYYGFTDFTLSNCYPSKTKNCFILQTVNYDVISSANSCKVCIAGYFMNADGFCEKYIVSNQKIRTNFVFAYYTYQLFTNQGASGNAFPSNPPTASDDLKYVKTHYLLSSRLSQYGVSSCSDGYIRLPAHELAPDICVKSSYIKTNLASLPADSKFIRNCSRYVLSGRNTALDCGGCKNKYIRSANSPTPNPAITCVVASQFPNCRMAEVSASGSRCKKCKPKFLNVNGLCVNTKIKNCKTHKNTVDFDSTLTTLQCTKCANGLVLANDFSTCTNGKILYCKAYTQGQPERCTECVNGYFLITLTAGFYCYPIPQSLKCDVLKSIPDETGSNAATISCKTCRIYGSKAFGAKAWVADAASAQTLCMPFNQIPNCQVYDQSDTTLTSNKFTCSQCSTGYWAFAGTGFCIKRVFNSKNCIKYSATSDACIKCSSGYFLANGGRKCIVFPNGIFGCNHYSAIDVCTQCNSPYFLTNNACVASTTTIVNCQVYSANSVCSQCAPGFFLASSTSCTTPTALNCLTYDSITACATCASEYGLQTTGGVTSCVLISVANCKIPTKVSPFTCMVCKTGYYPTSAGVCTLVTQAITNCLVYDTATTCTACTSYTVLNVARTVCNSNDYTRFMDQNCDQTNLLDSPVCLTCNFGFYFQNGVCSRCTGNILNSGCWVCDPIDNNICLICKPTYWMNSQGVCTPVNSKLAISPTNSTVSINKVLVLSFVIVSLYFNQF